MNVLPKLMELILQIKEGTELGEGQLGIHAMIEAGTTSEPVLGLVVGPMAVS